MDKQQVFYIHGGEAYSDYDKFIQHLKTCELRKLPGREPLKKWTSTLENDLRDEFELFMPSMPNSQNAKYQEWKIWFERHFEYLHDGVILLGWSQGGYFLAKYLTENDMPVQVKSLLLVAAPFQAEDFGGEDGGDFAFATDQVHVLAKKVARLGVFHSQDDPIVPFSHGEAYAAALPEAEFITFKDKNHFLVEEFPELIDMIKEMSKK